MEYQFESVLDQIQTFTQAAVHNQQMDAGQPYRYFLLYSQETEKPMRALRDSLKQRCGTIETIDSEVFLQGDVQTEQIMPRQGRRTQYNIICKATDSSAMEDFLPRLTDVFVQFYRGYKTMISSAVKLNIFLLFTFEDLNAVGTDHSCKRLAERYSALFCRVFRESVGEEELSCVYPGCDVYFLRVHEMNELHLSSLASDLFYLRNDNGGAEQRLSADFSKYTEDDYPWIYYTVQNSYCAERMLLISLREAVKSFYPCSPEHICPDPQKAADRIRSKLLKKMGLGSLTDLESLIEECCCFVPVEISEEEWESTGEASAAPAAAPVPLKPAEGIFSKLCKLLRGGDAAQDAPEDSDETETLPWNTDENRLEQSYRHYLHTVLNEDYFFSLLFGELSGMVGSNSSDAVYDALQSRLKRIVQDVFQGDQIPDIWKNTAEEYLRALTPDRVKEQCRVIQNSCADLIRKLINQENNWGAGLVLLVPPVNFTAFVRERFRLHAGDMSEMNRQLIGFLEEYRRNPAAVREFQQDYGNATAGGIAFQTDPPNPFITDSPAEHAPQHVPVQKDTFKLHRWYADSLNDMRP